MKPILFLLFAIAVLFGTSHRTVLSTSAVKTTPQELPLTSCAQLPASAVGITARRKATQTECSPTEARNKAVRAARINARLALQNDCRARTSRAEAQATCAAVGLAVVTIQRNGGLGPNIFRISPGIDASAAAGANPNARLCVVLDDLDNEFDVSTQADAICVLDGFKRTIFTARVRARCGVQCM